MPRAFRSKPARVTAAGTWITGAGAVIHTMQMTGDITWALGAIGFVDPMCKHA